MRKEKYYYCDMDGVLADFFNVPNALLRFAIEKDFFYNLKPIMENVNAIRTLIKNGASVRVLSASPNERADNDKRRWLKKYIPELTKDRIIIVRIGVKKLNYMQTKNGVLFDDYGKNGREWLENPNNEFYKISKENPITSYVKCV